MTAECPHCSFRFSDPDQPIEVGARLCCPECRGPFFVLSIEPPEFHFGDPRDFPGALFAHTLVAEGMCGDGICPEDVMNVVERARKQGLSGITIRVQFDQEDRKSFSIEVISLED